MRRLTLEIFRLGEKRFGESDAIETSLKIDGKQHNKNILLLLVGSDFYSFSSFLRLSVFCSIRIRTELMTNS